MLMEWLNVGASVFFSFSEFVGACVLTVLEVWALGNHRHARSDARIDHVDAIVFELERYRRYVCLHICT